LSLKHPLHLCLEALCLSELLKPFFDGLGTLGSVRVGGAWLLPFPLLFRSSVHHFDQQIGNAFGILK
jgi:hypothetical protein